MPLSYDEVRTAVLRYLRRNPRGEVPQHLPIFEQGQAVTDKDRQLAQVIFHELYLERVIVTGAGVDTNVVMSWPFYEVTEYGKQVLESTEYEPHDPSGYLRRLQQEIPSIDDTIRRYLEEALTCYRHGTLLAAAVMLGCASEKAALLLIEAFGNAIADHAKRDKYEKATSSWMISKKYDAFWNRLEPIASTLPRELSDDIHTILDRVFDLIRATRNAAGHPTGKTIDRNVLRANFIVFPSYCVRVYGLVDYFSKNPANI